MPKPSTTEMANYCVGNLYCEDPNALPVSHLRNHLKRQVRLNPKAVSVREGISPNVRATVSFPAITETQYTNLDGIRATVKISLSAGQAPVCEIHEFEFETVA
jgi:hypothetical protein